MPKKTKRRGANSARATGENAADVSKSEFSTTPPASSISFITDPSLSCVKASERGYVIVEPAGGLASWLSNEGERLVFWFRQEVVAHDFAAEGLRLGKLKGPLVISMSAGAAQIVAMLLGAAGVVQVAGLPHELRTLGVAQ